jgi:FSR family fosmidomycin resistance protein-like MFS transporter
LSTVEPFGNIYTQVDKCNDFVTDPITDVKPDKSELLVTATLTTSHLVQHMFSGASILYPSIKDALNLNYTQIGLMIGLTNIIGGFLQMLYSIASRKVSRRILLTGSNFFLSLGCMVMGTATRFEAAITGNMVSGVGQAGIHPISSSIIGSKFEKKGVGSHLSIFYGLGYVGNIISPLLLSGVAAAMSWRVSYYLLSALFFGTGLLVYFGLRGEKAGERALEKESGRKLLDDVKAAIRVKGAVPILAAQAFISGGTGMGVMTTWIPVYLRDAKGLGLTVFNAGIISSFATVGGVLGTLYLGRLGDKRGYLKTATMSLLVTTTCILLLTLYQGFSIILVPHLFLLSMTTFSMSSMLQAHLVKSSSPELRDILLGLFFTFGFGVSSLWSTLLGAVIDAYSFKLVWLLMVGAGLAAQICLYMASRHSKDNVP